MGEPIGKHSLLLAGWCLLVLLLVHLFQLPILGGLYGILVLAGGLAGEAKMFNFAME